jgi:DnaJ-class molecular chaperone
MSKDYYKTLGVDKKATEPEIKAAFRKLAHQYHPDKNKGDDKKFKEINEAYQTLSDKNKRAQYDQFGSGGPQFGGGQQGNPFGGQGGFGGYSWEDIMRQAQQGGGNQQFDFGDIDLGDLFGSAFGFGGGRRVRRGRSVETQVTITFKESIFGVQKDIDVPQYKDGKQTGSKKITIDIPAGIDSGQQMQMDGAGEILTDGEPGKLFITIQVGKHPTFRKEGPHIIMDMNVKLSDALLGTDVLIETLDGKETVHIPAGLEPGELIRIKGKGVRGGMFHKGDLIIKTKLIMPKKLSKEAKKAIEELRKEI